LDTPSYFNMALVSDTRTAVLYVGEAYNRSSR